MHAHTHTGQQDKLLVMVNMQLHSRHVGFSFLETVLKSAQILSDLDSKRSDLDANMDQALFRAPSLWFGRG